MTATLDRPTAGVARLVIDRPDRMNAIDPPTEARLKQAWVELERDSAIRCVILTGRGEKAFCAGADIPTFLPELGRRLHANEDDGSFCGATGAPPLSKPVIAAVNGVALGGGLELALASDIRIAAAHARFALPEVTLGVLAAGGGASRLPRAIPQALAAEMLLTGRTIGAEDAHKAGLISEVCPSCPALEERALAIAERIAAAAPAAVRHTLAILRASNAIGLAETLNAERRAFAELIDTDDFREGLAAFEERRPPRFAGR